MLRAAVNRGVPVVATNHVMPDNMVKNIKALAPISKPVSYFYKRVWFVAVSVVRAGLCLRSLH